MSDYPPERHVLRDLRLWTERDAAGTRSGMPVVPEIRGPGGDVMLGALATLVDVAGGDVAVRAADPERVATRDLVLHRLRAVRGLSVDARPELVRRTRTSIVLSVELGDGSDEPVAVATTSFAIVPPQGSQRRMGVGEPSPRTDFALPGSGLDRALIARLGARRLDAAGGRLELALERYTVNSLGGLQGGVAALLAVLAAEAAGEEALGAPCAARDLALSYLSLARESPVATSCRLLRRDGAEALLRVDSRDGSGRRTTLASVGVVRV